WKSPGQRKYSENDLPEPKQKRKLYELGREILENSGYIEIGMDHFALNSDSLYQAAGEEKLHRNFMGYTSSYTELLIGLGVSSISDTWDAFMQNRNDIREFFADIHSNKFPIIGGHILKQEDLILRQHILNLICNFKTEWANPARQHPALMAGVERMK